MSIETESEFDIYDLGLVIAGVCWRRDMSPQQKLTTLVAYIDIIEATDGSKELSYTELAKRMGFGFSDAVKDAIRSNPILWTRQGCDIHHVCLSIDFHELSRTINAFLCRSDTPEETLPSFPQVPASGTSTASHAKPKKRVRQLGRGRPARNQNATSFVEAYAAQHSEAPSIGQIEKNVQGISRSTAARVRRMFLEANPLCPPCSPTALSNRARGRKRNQKVSSFVEGYIQRHGRPPSARELRNQFPRMPRSTVYDYIKVAGECSHD